MQRGWAPKFFYALLERLLLNRKVTYALVDYHHIYLAY